MTELALRRELVVAARVLSERGLNPGTSGNLSARVGDRLLITPSAVAYDTLDPDDLILLTADGAAPADHPLAPSTEWRLHAAILDARPDMSAVVHTHAMFCTTLACLRRDIPAFHYMIAVAGGASIRCAPYHLFGTSELAVAAVTALEDRRACLLANHGMVALGASPAGAVALAQEVETLAAQYWRALQVGEPALLTDAEMAEVLARFATYGR